VLLGYEPNGLFLAFLVLLVALYIKGVVVLTRRGDKWPVNRTIFFALGISVADFAVNGGLGLYSHVAFSFHMVAHMALATLAPIGIVLGAPITLALRTLPIGRAPQERGIRGYVLSLLHSRYSRFLTNPVVAMLVFDGSMFALYFTDLFKWLMSYHFGHFFMEIHFLIAGFLFFAALIGVDPIPNKFPFVARIVVILAAMSIHAFFSVSLMSSSVLVDGRVFRCFRSSVVARSTCRSEDWRCIWLGFWRSPNSFGTCSDICAMGPFGRKRSCTHRTKFGPRPDGRNS